jgi:protein-L-isoaspartate(D-aspartate) O-methyltransferase
MERPSETATVAEWAAAQRRAMVDQQLRRRGVRDPRVLEAMGKVPRHEFVPIAERERAYEDRPLAIGQGQTISQPYIVAMMVEALELRGPERVLEIGTGCGYQAAVLARLAARVYTMERDPMLAESARARLAEFGVSDTVEVIAGDGSAGYPTAAPYDGIIVAAAAPRVPAAFLDQLVEGGRLVIPVGSLDHQELRQIRRIAGQAVSRTLGHCRFVPLTGRHGWSL